jgi:hypothetical protein
MTSSPLLHPYAERVRAIVANFLANEAEFAKSAALLAALWDEASREYPADSDVGRSFAQMGFPLFVMHPFITASALDLEKDAERRARFQEDANRVALLIPEAYERFLAIERGRLTSA